MDVKLYMLILTLTFVNITCGDQSEDAIKKQIQRLEADEALASLVKKEAVSKRKESFVSRELLLKDLKRENQVGVDAKIKDDMFHVTENGKNEKHQNQTDNNSNNKMLHQQVPDTIAALTELQPNNELAKTNKENKPNYNYKVDPLKTVITGMELVDVKKVIAENEKLTKWLQKYEKLPAWLKEEEGKTDGNSDAIILRELSKKVDIEKELNGDEKNTVDRFIKALQMMSDEDLKMKKKKTTKREMMKKNQIDNEVGTDEHSCQDTLDDCVNYQDYCTTHKSVMKRNCPKTCGICYNCDADEGSEEYCKEVKEFGLCGHARAKKYCSKTCKACQPQASASCLNSVFGCCWDQRTLKADWEGSNCPVCEDKFGSVCPMFKHDCGKKKGAGEWMRKYCKVTCKVCEKNDKDQQKGCKDEEHQREFCPVWENAGWCVEKEEVMQQYCAHTCQLCNMK